MTLRRIYKSQPAAANATLDLLTLFIEQAQAAVDAINASLQDIKNN
ncbi:hypothetical protein [Chroogloeocystis siderophila]|nr:hypothetical protein [Chroogloeocystis siderophila]